MEKQVNVCETIPKELEGIVGKENVLADDATLEHYAKDESWAPPKRPDWVVRAKSAEEVQEIVRLANQHRVPVVPRSSGVGFHGSGIPEQGGIVIDLKGMGRVLRIDTRNKWAMVEPGVTYGQLQKELRPHGFRAANPLLPHSKKSVVASLLEKVPHLTPKSHLDEIILTMRLVLPTGDRFRTGSLAVLDPDPTLKPEDVPDKARSSLCNPHGPGFDWFRLLTGSEGTLGIVTAMNFRMEPLPTVQKLFFLPFKTIEELIEPAYSILRREIGNECFILNRHNLASILADTEDEIAGLKDQLPPFCLVICLDAGEWYPEEKVRYQATALHAICEQFPCEPATALPPLAEADMKMTERLSQPWENGVYWKSRYRGGCWDIPLLTPLDKAPTFIRIVKETAAESGYPFEDIGIYLQPKQRGRVYHLEFGLPVDRTSAKESENVKALLHEAAKRLLQSGAFIYRPYGSLAEMVYSRTGNLHSTLRKIKEILDPNNVMNPGKLAL
jgi:FAD/FMN-containing dehydrogenase